MKLALKSFLVFLLLLTPAFAQTAAVNDDARLLHLLNRISYGPAPGDIETLRQMGVDAYIEQQLHPERLSLPAALQARLDQLPAINATMADVAKQYQPAAEKLPGEEKGGLNKRLSTIRGELSEAKILRAIGSPAQLQEVMTDFWFNHFNVYFGYGLSRVLISTYERDAIRPYVLGHFRDLLGATAKHPAMLFYLVNCQNIDADGEIAPQAMMRRDQQRGFNENYAREIMELHTLGLNGGYTQQDVTTLAYILTGWGLGRGKTWADKAVFAFDPQHHHDDSSKTFLGQTVRGDGEDQVEHVLDILASHPSTAHHIAYELAQYFVADDPPASLVNKLALTFRKTDGDITAVLKTLFHSPEFWDPKYEQVKFKPPFRYVVSSLRALAIIPSDDARMLQDAISGMGEPLYSRVMPDGYPNTNSQWLNSDSLLKRINFAKDLERLSGTQAAQTIEGAYGHTWSSNTLHTVDAADPSVKPVLLLSSPEFLYH